MPFIPVPNTIRISLHLVMASQNMYVTLHVKKVGAVGSSDLVDAAVAMYNWWDTYLRPISSNQVTCDGATAMDMSSDSGGVYTHTQSPAVAGASTAAPFPNNVAAVISTRTALRGRSYRGRMFIPGLRGDYRANASEMDSSLQSALIVAAVNLASFFTAASLTPAVASRWHANEARAVGVATEIISFVVDTWLDSQRRRLTGRGN